MERRFEILEGFKSGRVSLVIDFVDQSDKSSCTSVFGFPVPISMNG